MHHQTDYQKHINITLLPLNKTLIQRFRVAKVMDYTVWLVIRPILRNRQRTLFIILPPTRFLLSGIS